MTDKLHAVIHHVFTDKKQIHITETDYRDQTKIDIREYYYDEEEDVYKASQRGVRIPMHRWIEFVNAVNEVPREKC